MWSKGQTLGLRTRICSLFFTFIFFCQQLLMTSIKSAVFLTGRCMRLLNLHIKTSTQNHFLTAAFVVSLQQIIGEFRQSSASNWLHREARLPPGSHTDTHTTLNTHVYIYSCVNVLKHTCKQLQHPHTVAQVYKYWNRHVLHVGTYKRIPQHCVSLSLPAVFVCLLVSSHQTEWENYWRTTRESISLFLIFLLSVCVWWRRCGWIVMPR